MRLVSGFDWWGRDGVIEVAMLSIAAREDEQFGTCLEDSYWLIAREWLWQRLGCHWLELMNERCGGMASRWGPPRLLWVNTGAVS